MSAPAEATKCLAAEAEARRRPELRPEHAEREVGVGHELVEHRLPGRTVPLCVPGELGDVLLERRREEDARPVREGRSRGELGVQVLEPAGGEVGLELRVCGRPGEERMPRGEDLVREARNRQLFREHA